MLLLIVLTSVLALGVAAYVLFAPSGVSKDAPALHATQFREFPLVAKTQVNHNSAIYRFQLHHPEAVLGLPIGQHVSVAATIDGKEVVRSYTPVSNDSLPGYVDILVKTYPNGNISKYFSELQIGDKVQIRGPKGAFNYTPNTFDQISMIAGGSGVTPMFQILQAIATNPEDTTPATLIFANVNEVDIFLRKELDEFAAMKPGQISVHYVLNNAPINWQGSIGFVTAEIMAAQLPPPTANSKLLLCGPFPMVSAIKKASLELGWEKARAPSKMEHQVFVF